MFTLISGLPGSGKSLHTIRLVEKERVREDGSKRPVYFWGIPELKTDWIPLHSADSTPEEARARYDKGLSHALPVDAFGWFKVPPESIVVIDEAQYIFPKLTQKQAADPPEHYKQLAIHRHSGTDLYAMTQHPSLLAVEARRQVQRHWHLERPFGLDYTNRLAWERCMSPDDRAARSQANVERLPIDKAIFGLYRSAEVHTVKKRLPWKKLVVLVAALGGVLGLGLLTWNMLTNKEAENIQVTEAGAAPATLDQAEMIPARFSPESLTPRLETWPWSAPIYDGVANVVSFPRITGCMSMKIGNRHVCTCHDGQGVANVSDRVCRDFIAGRYFDPTKPYVDAKAENIERLDAGSGSVSNGDGDSGSTARVASNEST